MTEVRALVVPDTSPDADELLGMVAWYDHSTRCGIIVTNDCRLGGTSAFPEFKAEERDFMEYAAKAIGEVVVFKHSDGYATRIRRYRNCRHDYELALEYYGSHESVDIDGKKTNMLRRVHIPSEILTHRVLAKIEREQPRTPEGTSRRFRFMMRHFPKQSYVGRRFAFDRDYAEGTDGHWRRFFAALTPQELKAIMNDFPSVGNFIDDKKLLEEWAADWHPSTDDKDCMQAVKWNLHLFDDALQTELLGRIHNAAMLAAEEICAYGEPTNADSLTLRKRLLPYSALAGNDFRALIAETVKSANATAIETALARFVDMPDFDSLEALKAAMAKAELSEDAMHEIFAQIEAASGPILNSEDVALVDNLIKFCSNYNEASAIRIFSTWLASITAEQVRDGLQWPDWIYNAGRKYADAICNAILAIDLNDDANVAKAAWLCTGLANCLFDEETQQTLGFRSPEFNRLFDKLDAAAGTCPRLRAILWASFHRSKASQAEIKSTFALLPPDVQVRAVRRIGLRIAYRELNFTAENLYRILSGAGRLCVELEIMFGYLRFRDARPQESFTEDHLATILRNCADSKHWRRIYALAPDANIDHLPTAEWHRYTLLDFMRLLNIPYSATIGGRHYVNAHYTRFRVVLNEFAYLQGDNEEGNPTK